MDALNYGSLNFQNLDFSFLAAPGLAVLKQEEEASTEQPSEPPPSVSKPAKKPVKPSPRMCECNACYATFPDPGFKAPYCVKCEEPAQARRLRDAIEAILFPNATPASTAPALKAEVPTPEVPRCGTCRMPYTPVYAGARYCKGCAKAYKEQQQNLGMPQRPNKVDPAYEAKRSAAHKHAAEIALREALIEGFKKRQLPEGVTMTSRSGTQTIFRLADGTSLTCHIERTAYELEQDAAMKRASEQARLESEARAEAERKHRKAEEAAAKAAKQEAKGGKHKKG
jgi:hypothetical protein